MAILQAASDTTNAFFMHVGERVLKFAKKNDLTVNDMAVNLGWLAGTFAITAMRAEPERHKEAGSQYVTLCEAAVGLGAARAQIMQEEGEPRARRKHGGPSNG